MKIIPSLIRKVIPALLSMSIFLTLKNTASAQSNGRLSGSIINRLTQKPMAGLTVKVSPGNFSQISDSIGNFRFATLVPGSYALLITGVDIEPKSLTNLTITSGNENNLLIEVNTAIGQLSTVTVSSKKNTARATSLESPLSIQRLTTEEIKANPGGNFDISKVIQSLPGVGGGAAGGSFRNDIIIRGGAPSENVFYLDGIEVPIINHFSTQGSGGGPQGILNVSFIEDVKLSTSAFDARYDNALSSVFQFKQKNGNPNKLQGNFRLSGTEVAATFDGPLTPKTTFLASARRSYLQLLFQALDLPIRPNYWDFQAKTSTRINKNTTLTFLGIGAIDEFGFAAPKTATPEKKYIINSNPMINQWSYTFGTSLKRITNRGFWNLSLSRNSLNNQADKYLNNDNPNDADLTFRIRSVETENKLRWDATTNFDKLTLSYGVMTQYVSFTNDLFQILRAAGIDSAGNNVPAITITNKTELNFIRYGGFIQAGSRLLNNRLSVSAGIRIDGNSLKNSEANPFKQWSPRVSAGFAINSKINFNASVGLYHRLPSYTQLAFSNPGNGNLNPGKYIQSTHYVTGFEYLPKSTTRFTLEGFYKSYRNYPVSINDGISLANKGTEFGAIGNEPIDQNGTGRAYGFEFFAQQKLTKKLFGVFSYTLYWSEFTGKNKKLAPASWDNRHLISLTAGYKLGRNWEIGVKFRYQGEAPFTPYDEVASRNNYVTLGTGVFDYSRLNTQRLPAFHSGDLRIDKKWNFKKITFDLFLDVQNFYGSKATGVDAYTFKRTADNSAFETTDNLPLQPNGSNATPVLLKNIDGNVLPTIGFIVEF
jgi:outer membrane receptor for ferrienterochelin and colicin